MFGNPALVEDDVALGVDPAGDEGGRHGARRLAKLLGIVRHRHRMQVDDAIEAMVRRLHLDEAFQSAEIIAEVKASRRLNAGEDEFGKLGHFS